MAFWFFGKKRDGEINKLKENLKGSFLNIKGDIRSIHTILSLFKEKHESHDQKFERLERDLAEIRQLLEKRPKIATESKSMERSIVHERSRAFKRSNQSFMNVQSLKNLKEVLTPAQKRVIQLLNSTEVPLEYEEIARELKLSIVTVRRHINDIKKMGFRITEKMNIDTKRKIFYIEGAMKRAILRKR
jgi:DNA-binding CsgD family transcriptional regulator